MTLKEKFDVISCRDCTMPYCDGKCTILSDRQLNKLEHIADEFAEEFLYWYQKRLTIKDNGLLRINVRQVLIQFKKEKGL